MKTHSSFIVLEPLLCCYKNFGKTLNEIIFKETFNYFHEELKRKGKI